MTLVLSRYACLRRDGRTLIAEGRHPGQRLELEGTAAAALLHALVSPRPLEAAAAAAGRTLEEAEGIAHASREAGIVVDADEAAREDASIWAFDDARFHARTRGVGLGPFPPHGAPPAPAALPADRGSASLALPRPDLDRLERDDPPFAAVQAARSSVRRPRQPITLAELGEFLFRVGRAEDYWRVGAIDFAPRPYPAAGALYELELYVAAADCVGVEPALYHYAADHHRIARVGAADELLIAARAAMGAAEGPQALVVIGGRFPRLAWKYGPLAYSLMLKNVGVVFETMYLAATAMGLGACALGGGDAAAFAAATGLDPEEETSVGELCLSGRSDAELEKRPDGR